jgi:hypothetical protein
MGGGVPTSGVKSGAERSTIGGVGLASAGGI